MAYIRRTLIAAIILLIGSSAFKPAGATQAHHADGGSQSFDSEVGARRLRLAVAGMTEDCLHKLMAGKPMPSRVDQCFAMLPAQRWRGLWRDDFEGSRFCPVHATACASGTPGDRIWLSFAGRVRSDERRPSTSRLYLIEFIGRRTRKRGSFGHMGMSEHELLVDRLIRMTPQNEHHEL